MEGGERKGEGARGRILAPGKLPFFQSTEAASALNSYNRGK